MTARKTILLHNSISEDGHHDSWAAMCSVLLLARGYNVICLTPNPKVIKANLAKWGKVDKKRFFLLSLPPGLSTPVKHLDQKMMDRKEILRLRVRKLMRVPKEKSIPGLGLVRHFLLYMLPNMLPTKIYRLFPGLRFLESMLMERGRNRRDLVSSTLNAIKEAPWKPSFMLSMYIDSWLAVPASWTRFTTPIPIPWGGIRFSTNRNKPVGTEYCFKEINFRGLCFLDKKVVENYIEHRPGWCYQWLPDVTMDALPAHQGMLVKEIRRLAEKRTIILLCGVLNANKNIQVFYELARMAPSDQYFFAIIGKNICLQENREALELFVALPGGNTFYHDIHFKDEREMNGVIQSADIIFAVYKNFKESSNILRKAAAFQKPALVSDQYCMGERVRHYGIGLCVPEDGVYEIFQGLKKLQKNTIPSEKFERFCSDFSVSALGDCLESFIQNCLKSNKR